MVRVSMPSTPRVAIGNARGRAPCTDVRRHRLLLALHRERPERLDLEEPADVAVGVVGDEDAADRRRVLEPARHVHGVADRGELTGRADGADERRAGVDADAHREAVVGRRAELGQRLLQAERGADGALGVVLAGDVGAPDGHQRVADVLVDAAAVLDDDRVEPRPQRVHEVHHELGVAGLRHRGEAADVGEQDRDLAAPALAGAASWAWSAAIVASTTSSGTAPRSCSCASIARRSWSGSAMSERFSQVDARAGTGAAGAVRWQCAAGTVPQIAGTTVVTDGAMPRMWAARWARRRPSSGWMNEHRDDGAPGAPGAPRDPARRRAHPGG